VFCDCKLERQLPLFKDEIICVQYLKHRYLITDNNIGYSVQHEINSGVLCNIVPAVSHIKHQKNKEILMVA